LRGDPDHQQSAAIGSNADPSPTITFTQVATTVGLNRNNEPPSAGTFTSANTLEEEQEAKAILSATKSTDRQQFIPKAGVHGSSTLIAAKNPGGADDNWQAVFAFLKRVAP